MKAGQGKNKGSGFEREVCAKLSLWISKGERKDLICRTVGSGAQFTVTKGQGNPGDLMAQHPLAFSFFNKFVVECKWWKDIQFLRFLEGGGELYAAMQKVEQEAKSKDKMWWLVAKQNHRKTILLTTLDIRPIEFLTLNYNRLFSGLVYMFYLDDFLATVPPERLADELSAHV